MTTKVATIRRIVCGVIFLAILAFIACLILIPRLSDTLYLKYTYKNEAVSKLAQPLFFESQGLDIFQVNCTPKVRHKTFGVQFKL